MSSHDNDEIVFLDAARVARGTDGTWEAQPVDDDVHRYEVDD